MLVANPIRSHTVGRSQSANLAGASLFFLSVFVSFAIAEIEAATIFALQLFLIVSERLFAEKKHVATVMRFGQKWEVR